MPSTAEPPTTTTPPETHATGNGIAQGAPSTGAAPSSFRPPNPALEASKARMMEKWRAKAPSTSATPEKTEAPPVKPVALPSPVKSTTTPPPAHEPETPADVQPQPPPAGEDNGADEKEAPGEPGEPKSYKKDAPAAEPKKEGSPWRRYDALKKDFATLESKLKAVETENAALKTAKPAEIPKEVQEELAAARARIKEYEEEIRFTNYQKHPEFIEKYQKPFHAAMAKAMAELSEVTVTTNPATGATRTANAEDMLTLLNLPLDKARETADAMFGALADDVMAHRREIKKAFDDQKTALEEARKNGEAWEKKQREQREAAEREVVGIVNDTWSAARREATADPKHGKYFTPVEGDQKGNAALAKGIEFAEKAFKLNPMEPGLSKEERADRVKRHAAMLYRTAAYPRMRQWIEERDARIAELEKQLDEYAESEPGQAGGTAKAAPAPSAPGVNFRERFTEILRKKAR